MQLEENYKMVKLIYPPLDDGYIQSTSAPSKWNRNPKIDHTQTLRKSKNKFPQKTHQNKKKKKKEGRPKKKNQQEKQEF
jgi:hypothetical protein